jgi:hypothetical protein
MEQVLKFINLQKGRHILTLRNGVEVKGGEPFEAKLSDVPEAFSDCVKIIAVGEGSVTKEANKEEKALRRNKVEAPAKVETGAEEDVDEVIEETGAEKEILPTKTYTKKHIGGGKYNVLDEAGVAQNETPLTGAKGQQLIDSLTVTK